MNEWKEIAKSEQVKEDEPFVVEVDDEESVLLTRVDGKVCACSNECPHVGGPLGDGVLRDGTVVCPYHNAAFALPEGRSISGPAIDDLTRYAVRETDGTIVLGPATPPEITMPDGSDDRSVLIVGGGAAGSACAEGLRREGFPGPITMLTSEHYTPYNRPMLSKAVIADQAPATATPLRDSEFYNRLHIDVKEGEHATAVDPEKKRVTTESGAVYSADLILIATGAEPRRVDVPGAHLHNVFTLRTRDDAAAIAAAAGKASSAVVMGASFIGMEVAAQLQQRDLKVAVVEPRAEPMEHVLGDRLGRRLRMLHESNGVDFHMGRTPSRIEGTDQVDKVTLDDGTEITADLVVIGVGVSPRLGFLDGTELRSDGSDGLRVDRLLQTNSPGIYGAGDIARFPAHGSDYRVEHWVHAMQQGRHVARAMLGHDEPFTDVPFFWTRQYMTTVKYAGYPNQFDAVEYAGDPDEGEFIAGYFVNDALTAISAMGMQESFATIVDRLRTGRQIDRAGFYEIAGSE